MLNGHSISGAYIGVECRGAKWAILGPGSIVGGHDGILYTFPGALHPKLTLRDLVIDDNDDVAVAAEGGGRIVADGVEASGNAMGLAASRIAGRNLSVTGNGGFGLYSDRLLLRDSIVTGNNGAPGGVDISSIGSRACRTRPAGSAPDRTDHGESARETPHRSSSPRIRASCAKAPRIPSSARDCPSLTSGTDASRTPVTGGAMEPTLRSVRLGGLLVLCMTWALPAAAQPVRDHLECYKVKDPQPKARYTADVAGLTAEPGCTIKVPATMVCVPASKTSVQPAPPGGGATGTPNAFGCYKVKCPAARLPAFRLNDQFGSRSVTPIASRLLCAPSAPLCTGAVDCPIGTACNTTTGQCDPACGDASHSVCHGGCCGGGTCQPGTVATACGNGGDCAVCDASNQSGSACVAGHCGCTSPADCPAASGESAGRACLLAGVFVCVSQCNAPNVGSCNGGCCSAVLDGTCQSGTADTACGNGGGTCVDCTSSLATCTSGSCM